MAEAFLPTTQVTKSQLDGGWFSGKISPEQKALVAAFSALTVGQQLLGKDRARQNGVFTGADYYDIRTLKVEGPLRGNPLASNPLMEDVA